MNPKRLWQRIQQGHFHNVHFADLCRLMEAFGFVLERQSATSHRIYRHPDVHDKMNVQPRRDGSAKHYQVRQLRDLVQEYDLKLEGGRCRVTDYAINIFYDDEDGDYIAVVPDLKGCSAFGGTPEEALREVLVAKQLWLDVAREHGDPIPEPRWRPESAPERAAG